MHVLMHTHTHTQVMSCSDCINTLVGSGADVNVKDKKYYTPLHAAAAGGQCHAFIKFNFWYSIYIYVTVGVLLIALKKKCIKNYFFFFYVCQ